MGQQQARVTCMICSEPLRRLPNGEFADGRLVTITTTLEPLPRDWPYKGLPAWSPSGKFGTSSYTQAVCGICAAMALHNEQERAESAAAAIVEHTETGQ